MSRFAEIISVDRYAVYVFDYGGPIGFRMAVAHPERITAIISQNGNAYDEGLGPGFDRLKKVWAEPTEANRDALRASLTPPNAEIHLLDSGHFALETHAMEIADAIRGFLGKHLKEEWLPLASR